MARGRIPPPPAQAQWISEDDYNQPPPPYSEFEEDDQPGAGLDSLGLINGDYNIDCPFVTSQWNCYGSDFEMTLTLAGSALWGSFDLGIIEGVLFIDERPWQSSDDYYEFKWRGRESDGPIMYGDHHQGWIKFLGGGRIEGWFDYRGLRFEGERLPGQGTRSSRDARSLRMQWDGYSEEEYDRANRARWH
ncbi:hypothetical protein HRG_000335 [Hirsutella rhossiliensis]|uniref:Uncharacterized protein n=1 Tax=Hirsutella rhossiliensis TaxID=111463 RepID=A0A9P8N4Y1_9HYPO|nr:uncharacterized protein HRG_00335 [Hirsutella rhossiliensis]KAH0967693.1 hypothetical protein HRG_00335 [Hirsutella rhossiliensis]